MTDETAASAVPRARGLAIATAGIFGAILLSLLFTAYGSRLLISADSGARTLAGYLVFWVPLVAAVAWWARSQSVQWRQLLGFRPIDLLWGLFVGLLARALAGVIEWLAYGASGASSGSMILDDAQPTPWVLVLTAVIAPVILAPIIEELFFRGVLLTSLRSGSRSRVVAVIAIASSAVIFALVHLLQINSLPTAIAVGGATLVVGLATGILTVATGRLGGAIVAHIVFNGFVVALSLVG